MTIQKIKTGLHYFLWIFIVIIINILFVFILPCISYHTELWYFVPSLIVCILLGLRSGFSPPKAFLTAFFGNFIFTISFGMYSFYYLVDLYHMSIFLGLMGMAGAVLRRVIIRDFEELYLSTREWILLIGGVSAYADYYVFSAADLIFKYQSYFIYLKKILIVSVGVCILGVYAGAFFNTNYDNPAQKIKYISLGGHSGFVLYTIILLFMGAPLWKIFLFYSIIIVFSVLLLAGTKIGQKYKP